MAWIFHLNTGWSIQGLSKANLELNMPVLCFWEVADFLQWPKYKLSFYKNSDLDPCDGLTLMKKKKLRTSDNRNKSRPKFNLHLLNWVKLEFWHFPKGPFRFEHPVAMSQRGKTDSLHLLLMQEIHVCLQTVCPP